MFIDRQGTNQQAQKLNLSCSKLVNCTSKITNHTKNHHFLTLICVDLALKMGNQQDSTAHRWYSCACKILTICCLNVNNVILAKLKCGDMTILHREHHHENCRNGLFPWGICGKIEHTQPISRNTPYLDPPL